MKHNRIILGVGIIGLAALIIMLNVTSPTEIGPFGVLLFFTTLYAVFFSIFSLIMEVFYRLSARRETMRNKDYLYSAVLAFGPIMIMMARSFGIITPATIGLIFIFLLLAAFLVMKRV
ncbi:hypothetical protein IJJ39_00860 [Candidatus Saccharibacteria bacterium]|nr:hypothetical protein [Candidatus Saccharibacteria bacterium]